MAQRTIHYLIGEELIAQGGIRDVDRFRIGNLLPDAIAGLRWRDLTHFQRRFLQNGRERKYSDFEEFRREFAEKVENDDLYLGYYMHLVEDSCYRMLWREYGLWQKIKTEADVEILHQDYHLLNAAIVRRWGIRDELVYPAKFEAEPINRIYPFLLREFLEEMRGDFTEDPAGEMRIISEAFVERYVAEYLDVCRGALRRLLTGAAPLDPKSLSWVMA